MAKPAPVAEPSAPEEAIVSAEPTSRDDEQPVSTEPASAEELTADAEGAPTNQDDASDDVTEAPEEVASTESDQESIVQETKEATDSLFEAGFDFDESAEGENAQAEPIRDLLEVMGMAEPGGDEVNAES